MTSAGEKKHHVVNYSLLTTKARSSPYTSVKKHFLSGCLKDICFLGTAAQVALVIRNVKDPLHPVTWATRKARIKDLRTCAVDQGRRDVLGCRSNICLELLQCYATCRSGCAPAGRSGCVRHVSRIT